MIMAKKMLVDLERCVGCWSCAMACKVGNCLADDEYRVVVRTHGSGTGIDRPAGTYPRLSMGWQPVYAKSCVFCGTRVAAGEQPYCAYNCPTAALAFGDSEDAGSDYCKAMERVLAAGYRVFTLPEWDEGKSGITYASAK
jgi:Fe-S-cluster-containing dehydrogenase component